MKGVLFIELLDFSAKSVDSFLTAIISPVNKKKKKRKRRKKKRKKACQSHSVRNITYFNTTPY